MIVAFIVMSGLQVVAIFGALWLAKRYIEAKERTLRAEVRSFLTAPDEETPSLFAAYVDQIATLFTSTFMQSVMARVSGAQGNLGKEAKAMMTREVMESHPLLAIAAAFLPKKMAAMLISNPQFMGAFSKYLPGFTGVNQGESNNDGHSDIEQAIKRRAGYG